MVNEAGDLAVGNVYEYAGGDLSLSWNIGIAKGWPGGSANTTIGGVGLIRVTCIDDGSKILGGTVGVGLGPFPGALKRVRVFTYISAAPPTRDWIKKYHFGWSAAPAPGYCIDCFDY
jgi:hypothetical protein